LPELPNLQGFYVTRMNPVLLRSAQARPLPLPELHPVFFSSLAAAAAARISDALCSVMALM